MNISINGNTIKWLNLISDIQDDPKYDAVRRGFFILAFGSLGRKPPKLVRQAVKEKDLTFLNDWVRVRISRLEIVPFLNKMVFGRQYNVKEQGNDLNQIPFRFAKHEGVPVMIIRCDAIVRWLDEHVRLPGDNKASERSAGLVAIGVKNHKPYYVTDNGVVTFEPREEDIPEERVGASYRGRMTNATPVWRPIPPPHSGLYVAACFDNKHRDVLTRTKTPDSHTEIYGQEPGTRVGDNLYLFNAEAKEGESQWQGASGFFDNAVTHYLDFDVEYED